MNKPIFKFQEETVTQEDHVCEMCELIEDTIDNILNVAVSRDEVISFLVDAIYETKEIGYREGRLDAMKEIIGYGVECIRDMECNCCEECEEC